MLWKFNRNKKATRTDDLSLPFIKSIDEGQAPLLPNIKEYDNVRLLKDQGKLMVGISLKPMKDPLLNKRIVEEFSNALNTLSEIYEQKIHFIFFPFSKRKGKDEEFMQSVINNLKYKEKATVVSHTNPIVWYRTIKELADVFIGMRYHSIIFSFMAGKPVLSIPYEKKIIEFLRDYNRKNYPAVFPSEISESYIVNFIQRYQEKEDQSRERLQSKDFFH
jgi:polysaccharide pyruvyl transferase WcaK-like protein